MLVLQAPAYRRGGARWRVQRSLWRDCAANAACMSTEAWLCDSAACKDFPPRETIVGIAVVPLILVSSGGPPIAASAGALGARARTLQGSGSFVVLVFVWCGVGFVSEGERRTPPPKNDGSPSTDFDENR